ncbi:MAG: M48 family metalloprotease, partial [Candidatus Thorarchaeota archaeon]
NGTVDERAKRKLDIIVRSAERLLVERYGGYPQEHPLQQYVESIAYRLLSPEDRKRFNVVATRRWDDANACALPTGTVMFSDRLLQMCEAEEEISFVLNHEFSHIDRRHTEKMFRSMEDAFNILAHFGAKRIHEYESDIRSTLSSSEKSVNPYGGVVFLNRLYEQARRMGYADDLVHGSPLLRVLALHYTTRLVDLPALSHDLTPIPAAIKKEISTDPDPWAIINTNPTKTMRPEGVQNERKMFAARCSPAASIHFLARACERYFAMKEAEECLGMNLTRQIEQTFEIEVLKILQKNIDTFISSKYVALGKKEKAILRTLFLELCAGLPISKIHEDGKDYLGLYSPFAEVLTSNKMFRRPFTGDLETGREKLRRLFNTFSSGFPKDFVLEEDPSSFVKRVIGQMKECRKLTIKDHSFLLEDVLAPLKRAYDKRGIADVGWSSIRASIAKEVVDATSKRDVMGLKSLFKDFDIPLTTGDRTAILGAIQDSFSLSKTRLRRLDPSYKNGDAAQQSDEFICARDLLLGYAGDKKDKNKLYLNAFELREVLETLKPESTDDILSLLQSVWDDPEVSVSAKHAVSGTISSESRTLIEELDDNYAFWQDMDHKSKLLFVVNLCSPIPDSLDREGTMVAFSTDLEVYTIPDGKKSLASAWTAALSYDDLVHIYDILTMDGVDDVCEGTASLFNTIFHNAAKGWARSGMGRGEFFGRLARATDEFDQRILNALEMGEEEKMFLPCNAKL